MISIPADKPKIFPRQLFPELLQFNFLPTGYMDISWWQADWLPTELLAATQTSDRANVYLSQFLLNQFELDQDFDFDFSIEKKHLALLGSDQLRRLVYLDGLILQSDHIAHVIRSQDRQVLKDAVGEADYFFTIKRGKLLLDEVAIEPEKPDTTTDLSALKQNCYRLGIGSLATAMSDMPKAFIQRLQFKLPKSIVEEYWQTSGQNSGQDSAAHTHFLLRLSKESA